MFLILPKNARLCQKGKNKKIVKEKGTVLFFRNEEVMSNESVHETEAEFSISEETEKIEPSPLSVNWGGREAWMGPPTCRQYSEPARAAAICRAERTRVAPAGHLLSITIATSPTLLTSKMQLLCQNYKLLVSNGLERVRSESTCSAQSTRSFGKNGIL